MQFNSRQICPVKAVIMEALGLYVEVVPTYQNTATKSLEGPVSSTFISVDAVNGAFAAL